MCTFFYHSFICVQEEKTDSLTFFGLASSILRERKRLPPAKTDATEEEAHFQDEETFNVKERTLNYSKNNMTEETSEEESSITE